jgi:enoyl-[acyl-carrier-protein] reductase (NADH)
MVRSRAHRCKKAQLLALSGGSGRSESALAPVEPEQVAGVVAFLFTEGASAISGSTIPVEDGFRIFENGWRMGHGK